MGEVPPIPVEAIHIHLQGFTIEEAEDIISYIRSVEAHRETRKVTIILDTPTLTIDEAGKLIRKMYPG